MQLESGQIFERFRQENLQKVQIKSIKTIKVLAHRISCYTLVIARSEICNRNEQRFVRWREVIWNLK
jgi:hypothetical protein